MFDTLKAFRKLQQIQLEEFSHKTQFPLPPGSFQTLEAEGLFSRWQKALQLLAATFALNSN